ncbi:MAG: hypothetical protein P8N09_06480 [Planctomycetota bacterium]|jgi:hypothetical protein|nr:hypothetical protein [Planctomycetota bacterium]
MVLTRAQAGRAPLILLGLFLFFGGGLACHRQELLASDEDLADCTARARDALAGGAGIELFEDVPVILLTAAEAKQRRKEYAAGIDDEAGLTATIDFMADAMFSEHMLGRYLPDEKVIYVIEDVLVSVGHGDSEDALELLFPVLTHELVHAYDDQMYDGVPDPSELISVMEDPGALMGLHTQMSLLEGRASYASYLACLHAGVEPLPKPTAEQARDAVFISSDGSVGMDVLSGIGNGIGRMKFMQYVSGWEFAERAYSYGGEPFFKHVFNHLPLSMEELEEFDLFVMRWAEEMEEALDSEAEGLGDESGELAGRGQGT